MRIHAKHPQQCRLCNDIIFSMHPGSFTMCGCRSSFVDETEHYTRVGGEAEEIELPTRELFVWGTNGKKGDQETTWKKLKYLSNSHIENILKTQNLREEVESIFRAELAFRNYTKIDIKDHE